MTSSIFEFSGFASQTDIETKGWEYLFNVLEQQQADFTANIEGVRSSEYKWPLKPLHTWSRLWEYPYVYHHLRKYCLQKHGDLLHILDYGSGVTFFPFSVARLGCKVTCVDIDPVCAIDIPMAAKLVQHAPGEVDFALVENGRIPSENRSQDIVYCISVLEHIPDFGVVIDEIARVLKPGGKLILTVDIDLRGNFELGACEFKYLLAKLEEHFTNKAPERAVHPSDLLLTANSPFPLEHTTFINTIKQILKYALSGRLIAGDPRFALLLAIYATVLVKK